MAGVASMLLLVPAAIPSATPAGAHAPSPTSGTARPTLSLGDRGVEVERVQRRLGLTADGRFGPKTRRAVKALQGAGGLVEDGIVGPLTWEALAQGGTTLVAAKRSGGTPAPPPKAAAPPSQLWRTFGSRSHVVAPGETWTSIADAEGATATALAAANQTKVAARPAPGRRIQVPGSWRCPVSSGSFINDWGFPRPGGRLHLGNDLFARRGTPVLVPVSGRVERAENQIGGNAVELHGDDGHRYYFAHLDSYGASGRVKAGSTIGYVGSSGNADTTAPHLHFEVHPGGGGAVNPYPTITLACRR